MTLAEPVHGERQVLKAELNWLSSNHTIRYHGTFMMDSGCTSSILSQDFERKEKISVERWNSNIQMKEAQGD
jgi:hypothetical protein